MTVVTAGVVRLLSVALFGVMALLPSSAAASCKLIKLAELPVVLRDREALVDAKFGPHQAQLIVDSGASTSALSPQAARDFELKMSPAGFRMAGTNGRVPASVARTKGLAVGGVTFPDMTFVVGGANLGVAGLIGQDILGLADVEYDLPHGFVRLMRPEGCGSEALAYWANGKAVTAIPIEREADGPFRPFTMVSVLINGVSLRAKLDTGSNITAMKPAAAKRLGVVPNSPGVVETGYSTGIGSKRNTVWIAPFDRINIGTETTAHPHIYIEDMTEGADMLLGFDFFATHRVYVSNAQHRVYVTSEGGSFLGSTSAGDAASFKLRGNGG